MIKTAQFKRGFFLAGWLFFALTATTSASKAYGDSSHVSANYTHLIANSFRKQIYFDTARFFERADKQVNIVQVNPNTEFSLRPGIIPFRIPSAEFWYPASLPHGRTNILTRSVSTYFSGDVLPYVENFGATVALTLVNQGAIALTQDDIGRIIENTKLCWSAPSGLAASDSVTVEVRIQLDGRGGVRNVVPAGGMPNDPRARKLFESVYRALSAPACNTLPISAQQYPAIMASTFRFDLRNLLSPQDDRVQAYRQREERSNRERQRIQRENIAAATARTEEERLRRASEINAMDVHRQRLWDQIGDLSYGGFLAHRNPKESEDEPEILRPTRPCAS